MRRARTTTIYGSLLTLAASASGIAVGTTAAQARPATFSSCPGSYTAHVKATEPGMPPTWDSQVSKVRAQGTTCSNGHAVAGQFARANCGACKAHNSINGWTYKPVAADNLEYNVTARKGSETVKFFWTTQPA